MKVRLTLFSTFYFYQVSGAQKPRPSQLLAARIVVSGIIDVFVTFILILQEVRIICYSLA